MYTVYCTLIIHWHCTVCSENCLLYNVVHYITIKIHCNSESAIYKY